jgi:hypothetical protein
VDAGDERYVRRLIAQIACKADFGVCLEDARSWLTLHEIQPSLTGRTGGFAGPALKRMRK